MKRFILIAAAVLAAFAFAAAVPRRATVSVSGGTGLAPTTPDAGVAMDGNATSIRVVLTVGAGNVSGGKLYCYYLGPTGVGQPPRPTYPTNTWVRCPLLDLTVPTATEIDAGVIRGMVWPDFEVVGGYGHISFVPGTLTGTADDGGTNTYTVTTEAWGKTSP